MTFVSEAARIDLNEAPMPMLAGLFAAFGVKSEDAVEFANRIIGWRDPPKEGAAKEGAPPTRRGCIAPQGSNIRRVAGLFPMWTNFGWYTDCRPR